MSTTVTTPVFRASYPNLFQARLNDQNQKMEFSVVGLFDLNAKSPELKVLRDAAKAALEKKFGKDQSKWPTTLKTPFRDQGERAKNVDGKMTLPAGYEKGKIFITFRSKDKPGIVDKTGKNIITDETEIYAGCYLRAKVNAFAYQVKGNAGVSFGLQHIQKVRDGEPLGSRTKVEDAFEAVEGAADEEASTDDLGF